MGGADLGYWLVSNSHMESANKVIERDRKFSSKIRETADKLQSQVKKMGADYSSFSEEGILNMISVVIKSMPVD